MLNSTAAGIFCGTGSVYETFDDYQLASKIASGTGTGQMTYMQPTTSGGTYNSTTKKWSIAYSRICKNTSGNTIDVCETGLYGSLASANYDCMFERNVFPSAISVPTGSQIEVTYTFEFVYPEPAV
jgi:hypothetical protein